MMIFKMQWRINRKILIVWWKLRRRCRQRRVDPHASTAVSASAYASASAVARLRQLGNTWRSYCRRHVINWDSLARGMLIYGSTLRYDGASTQPLLGHPDRLEALQRCWWLSNYDVASWRACLNSTIYSAPMTSLKNARKDWISWQ